MRRLCITPGAILLLALFVLLDGEGLVLCGLFAVAVHEAAHAALLAAFGAGIARFSFSVFGGELLPAHPLRLSPGRELCVLLAGPAANLLCAAGIWFCAPAWSYAPVAAGVQLAAGLFNLLPVSGLDGGRALLCLCGEHARARAAVERSTFLFGLFALCGGTVLLCSRYHNPALLLFGLWSLFHTCKSARIPL